MYIINVRTSLALCVNVLQDKYDRESMRPAHEGQAYVLVQPSIHRKRLTTAHASQPIDEVWCCSPLTKYGVAAHLRSMVLQPIDEVILW